MMFSFLKIRLHPIHPKLLHPLLQKHKKLLRGRYKIRQGRNAKLYRLRRIERQNADLSRPCAPIDGIVHTHSQTGFHHGVSGKRIHRGKFKVRRNAAAGKYARIINIPAGVRLNVRLAGKPETPEAQPSDETAGAMPLIHPA